MSPNRTRGSRAQPVAWRVSMATAVLAAWAFAQGPDRPALAVYHLTTGGAITRVVAEGETLASLGARHGVSPSALARDNGLKAGAKLKPGQELRIDNAHIVPHRPDVSLVLNVPQRMLFWQGGDGTAIGYPVAVGRPDWRTPRGPFTVLIKEQDPTWDVPASIQREMQQRGQRVITRMPPCPENPLGEYWLGLSLPGVGIHGTPTPGSIYRAVTHGCIRLHPDDVRDLFPRVEAGAAGMSLYEPVLLAQVDGQVLLESHPDIYGLGPRSPLPLIRRAAAASSWTDLIDWSEVEAVLRRRDGMARVISRSP